VARSIVWPQIAPPAEAEPKTPPHGLDLAGLAAAFGPELARRIGIRVTAVPDVASPGEGATVLLGRIPLGGGKGPEGPQALHVGAPPDCAAMLLERLFGARASDAAQARGADLFTLPPGSASWVALCRTVSAAVVAALAAGGRATAGSPAFPPRAIALAPGPLLGLSVDADGLACRILLLPETAIPAPPPVAHDRQQFRQAARARAFDLELPVALRIAESRISLQQASDLSIGDILPIDPVQTLDVLAGGRRIARLPASAFAPPAQPPGEDQ
jgi:hypothetical protein